MASDACVHGGSNGASARSVNILSSAAQGTFRDGLSLQTKLQAPVSREEEDMLSRQHIKIYASLFVMTKARQKCNEKTPPDWFLSH